MRPSVDELIDATFREAERDGIESKLERAKISFYTQVPDLIPIVNVIKGEEKIPFGNLGNFSVIQGKPKSGKSFILLPIVASYLCQGHIFMDRFGIDKTENNKVLYFDTEQGQTRTKRIINRLFEIIKRDTLIKEREIIDTIEGSLGIYSLREFLTQEKFDMIERAIETSDAKLIVIDGIIDLINKNDTDEARRIAEFLMRLTERKQCHIITIIHENKEGLNSRGDVGAILDQKAEAVYRIERDGKQFRVIPHKTRDKEPPKMDFEIEEELPKIIGYNDSSQGRGRPKKVDVSDLDEERKIRLLKFVYLKSHKKTTFEYQNLIFLLKQSYIEEGWDKLGDNQVKSLISNLKAQEYLTQIKPREPYFLSDKLIIKFNEETAPKSPF
jgi:hypothetical protein